MSLPHTYTVKPTSLNAPAHRKLFYKLSQLYAQMHRAKHDYSLLLKDCPIYSIVSLTSKLGLMYMTLLLYVVHIRLEVKSQKGSRNHFREDGMLTFVTHANY